MTIKTIIWPLIIVGLFLIWIAGLLTELPEHSSGSFTNNILQAAEQLLLPAMLTAGGSITFWARRRGMAPGKAFGLPLLIQLLAIVVLFICESGHPDNRSLFPRWFIFAVFLVPMVVVCGIVALVVKPRAVQSANGTQPAPLSASVISLRKIPWPIRILIGLILGYIALVHFAPGVLLEIRKIMELRKVKWCAEGQAAVDSSLRTNETFHAEFGSFERLEGEGFAPPAWNLNVKNNKSETPLRLAMSRNHLDMAELLRQHGGK